MVIDRKLHKEDYDLYTIDLGKLPLACSSRKIRQLIRIQMEKLHPCFAEQCSFDYMLKKKKGKTAAQVIVIDSLVLARIMGTSGFSWMNAEEFGRKRLFLTERVHKARNITAFFIVLLFLTGVLLFSLPVLLHQNEPAVVELPVETTVEHKVHDINIFLADTLPAILTGDINISYIEYSSDKVPQVIVHESGMQRETVDKAIHSTNTELAVTYSATTYQEKVPFITFSVTCDKQVMKAASFADIAGCIAAIRNAVLDIDGLPVSEQYEIRQFQCIIPYKSFPAFLAELEGIQENVKAKFQKCIFDYNRDVGTINCIIVLEQFKCEEPIQTSLLANIFKAPVIKQKAPVKTEVPEIKKAENSGRTLIGKMPSADGGTILYYRTTEGKIEYERE